MRVVISAGGTGGHIYPALAIIHKIQKEEPNSKFLYIGTTDRMEHTIVPKEGIPYIGIPMTGLERKKVWKNVSVMGNFFSAIKKCKEEIRKFQPDIVIGVGGYITSPVIYAAKKLGYKTFIHEQNSIPGVSNKFLSHYADKIGVSLPSSIKLFDSKKVIYTGNPRSEEVISIPPIDKRSLHLDPKKKLVLIVMGSLGSMTMNQKLQKILPEFKQKEYEVLLITGKNYFESYQKIPVGTNVKILPYSNQLLSIMKKADLIISRAGASTISEITPLGLPSILVPSPYVTHNHQYKNAKELEKVGATLVIEEKDLDTETLLPIIDSILYDNQKYQSMQEQTKALGIVDSATRIYKILRNLIDGERR